MKIEQEKLQLIGEVCLLIASKLVDCCRIVCADFAAISENAYSIADIKEMEIIVVHVLDFNFNVITPLHFLRIMLAEVQANPQCVYLSFV